MLVNVHPENPQERIVKQIADCLKDGGVIIYPTDTVYGLGCDIFNQKQLNEFVESKGLILKKQTFLLFAVIFQI